MKKEVKVQQIGVKEYITYSEAVKRSEREKESQKREYMNRGTREVQQE